MHAHRASRTYDLDRDAPLPTLRSRGGNGVSDCRIPRSLGEAVAVPVLLHVADGGERRMERLHQHLVRGQHVENLAARLFRLVRQKIAEQIIRDIADDWNALDSDGDRHGPKALARLRKDDPARYVAAALGLVPKDWLISIQNQPSPLQAVLEGLSPDEAARVADALKLIAALGAERALELLRSEAAKPVPSDW